MDLRSTGITGLDKLLNGGVPKESTILVLGPSGSGKSILAKRFLWEGLQHNQSGVCLLTQSHRQNMHKSMKSFGWNITPYIGKTLLLLEAFTWSYPECLTDLGERELEYTLTTLNLEKLMHILVKATKQMGDGGRLVFDDLSDLFILMGDDRRVLRFLRRMQVCAIGKHYDTLITLDPDTQNPIATKAATHCANGVIELRFQEGKGQLKRQLRVRHMPQEHDSSWHSLHITPKGPVVDG
jgi:KaiC/GvpD/RAD55 family RecA-like ATPase